MTYVGYLALGLFAGVLSGLMGIGGGIIIIPALVYLFGLSQHQAQGTTLALMIPPIGLLAALEYYRAGNVNISMAGFICIGFFIGGFLGAKLALGISDAVLQKIFGVLLLLIAHRMIFWK